MNNRLKILLLAGTREAREIAAGLSGHAVTASLAGVTRSPAKLHAEVRTGGFGGVGGMSAYLRAGGYDLVVDATHPFAQNISRNAAVACEGTGTRLVHVVRAGWSEQAGDRWKRVPDLTAAAAALPAGARVFLATGSKSLGIFVHRKDIWCLARVIEVPQGTAFEAGEVLVGRPPFPVSHERGLMQRHRISHLVARDAGGADGVAKLTAARELELPVILVDRPAQPPGDKVSNVAEALEYVENLSRERT